MIYQTKPADAVVGMFGRRNLPDGKSTTALPLFDVQTGLFAQLNSLDAAAAAKRLGGRLPTRAEVLERFKISGPAGILIKPVILPNVAQRKAAPKIPGETDRQYEIRIRRAMASREWAEIHTRDALAQVVKVCAALGAQGAIVSNAGKHWIGPGTICGWLGRDRVLIQQGLRAQHEPHHLDYATTTIVMWDAPAP